MTIQEKDQQFEDILKYATKPNWNGYDADPIDEEIILACTKYVDLLFDYGYDKDLFVSPVARNSIQVEFDTGEKYLEFEFFKDTICAFSCDYQGKELINEKTYTITDKEINPNYSGYVFSQKCFDRIIDILEEFYNKK